MINNWIWIGVFLLSFAAMEFSAWFLHKYVMHGFLWKLHKDHHQPEEGKTLQKNDSFALFFAIPSFFFILFSSLYSIPLLGSVGFGIMAYGFAYAFVHEGVIHRRFRVPQFKSRYIQGLRIAHKVHHSVKGKEGCENFGMLCVPKKYFQKKTSSKKTALAESV